MPDMRIVYLICVAAACFVALAQPAGAQGSNTTLPLSYPGQVLQGYGNQTCPSVEKQERVKNEVDNATRRLFRESVVPLLQTQLPTEPPIEYSCGGSTGWRRVAYFNMSDSSQRCPSVWQEITTPHRVCRKTSITTGEHSSCDGVNYTTGSDQYDQVCGRIIGYQLGTPYAFNPYSKGRGSSIDGVYVIGVSVTHGSPRQHIWTFAGGADETVGYWTQFNLASVLCPCVSGSTAGNLIPPFVGQSYFCVTGITRWNGTQGGVLWPDGDPLWDGQGCGPTSSCCAFNSPPWFNVRLPSPSTDDIEVRLCGQNSNGIQYDDTPIQLLELYVK